MGSSVRLEKREGKDMLNSHSAFASNNSIDNNNTLSNTATQRAILETVDCLEKKS